MGGGPLAGWARGGEKCWGATERVVQLGSEAVRGGPRRMEVDSVRDWERRVSWAERKVGDDCGGGDGEGGEGG